MGAVKQQHQNKANQYSKKMKVRRSAAAAVAKLHAVVFICLYTLFLFYELGAVTGAAGGAVKRLKIVQGDFIL